MAQQLLVDQGLLIMEASLSHSDTSQLIGLLCRIDHPKADLYLTAHNTHKKQISMPPMGFELAIPASTRPQTHASDCAATGIGSLI
jgi:hypothetical protein